MDTKALRQKILDLAIRGKLVPQDPNDEPASVLLARIREEKERLIKEGKIKRSKKAAPADTPQYPNEELRIPQITRNHPFDIPDSWEWVSLPEVCLMPITDGTHQTPTYCEESQGIPFLSSKDVTEQCISWDKIKYITKDLHERLSLRVKPQKFDILLAKNGTTGVAAIVEDDKIFDIYVTLALLRPSKHINPYYLLNVINSKFCKTQFDSHLTGIGLPNLHLRDINKTLIPLPPIKEQNRILTELNKWFNFIDIIKIDKEAIVDLIQQTKSKLLALAIQGKLVEQDPSDEPTEVLLKRINPDWHPCDTSHYEHIPQGWCVSTLDFIGDSELGKTLDREKNRGDLKPYLCSLNILWDDFNLQTVKEMRIEPNEYERYQIKKGDLLICEGGEVGRTAVWCNSDDMFYQNSLHRVRFKEDMDPHYFMYLFAHLKRIGIIDAYSKGMTIKHFTKTSLMSLPLIIPPINEQKRIVKKVKELFALLDIITKQLK